MQNKKIGIGVATCLVIGNTIGAGIFLMPSTLASFGGISIIGWIVSATGALCIAKVFGHLSQLSPISNGGIYTFTHVAMGDFFGFIAAWAYYISIWTTNATITVSLVGALNVFIPSISLYPFVSLSIGLLFLWGLTWVNCLGIKESGYVQVFTTILKLIPLFLISILGLLYCKTEHFIPFNRSIFTNFEAITITTTLTLYAFLGIESATIPSESIENPKKNIPIATLLGTLVVTFVYVFSTISIMGVIHPTDLEKSLSPFADTAVIMWGETAKYLVGLGVVIATFGALNGWILVQGLIPHSLARDHLFPKFLSSLNKKNVPQNALIFTSCIISLLLIMNYSKGLAEQFKFLILLSTTVVLIPYLLSIISYIILLGKNKIILTKKKLYFSFFIGIGAFLYSFWAITGSDFDSMLWGIILIASGIPIYFLMKRKVS